MPLMHHLRESRTVDMKNGILDDILHDIVDVVGLCQTVKVDNETFGDSMNFKKHAFLKANIKDLTLYTGYFPKLV